MRLQAENINSRGLASERANTNSKFPQSRQSIDRFVFSGNPEKVLTRKEKFNAAWVALKKEFKNPKQAVMMISGLIGLVAVPAVIIASLFFPMAIPVLYPIAAGTSVWSGVMLWKTFDIAKTAYQSSTPK